MNTIMVVFSATSISERIAAFAIDKAQQENAKLILCDVRDKDISRKVSEMTGKIGFMGSEVVEQLRGEIKKERDWLIRKELKRIEKLAGEKGVEVEIDILKGPSADEILKIAKSKQVSTLIVQKRGIYSEIEMPFKVLYLT